MKHLLSVVENSACDVYRTVTAFIVCEIANLHGCDSFATVLSVPFGIATCSHFERGDNVEIQFCIRVGGGEEGVREVATRIARFGLFEAKITNLVFF